jgi:hypothetical protein
MTKTINDAAKVLLDAGWDFADVVAVLKGFATPAPQLPQHPFADSPWPKTQKTPFDLLEADQAKKDKLQEAIDRIRKDWNPYECLKYQKISSGVTSVCNPPNLTTGDPQLPCSYQISKGIQEELNPYGPQARVRSVHFGNIATTRTYGMLYNDGFAEFAHDPQLELHAQI